MPAYIHYDPELPYEGDPPAKIAIDAKNNARAIFDCMVFSGMATSATTCADQNADGSTPVTDPLLPAQTVWTLVSNANHKWKIAYTYGTGAGEETSTYYRSYDAGATWLLIKTTTHAYDGSNNWVSYSEV